MLDEYEQLHLVFMPFTNIKRSVESAIFDAAKLTNKANISQGGRNFIKEIQALLTEKFVSEGYREQIKREIRMYNNLFKEELDEVRVQGEQIGREEGIEIGREENTFVIARNMLENNRSIENIMADTGLTRKQIESL